MSPFIKCALGAATLAVLPLVSACGETSQENSPVQATKEEKSSTLAGALNSEGNMSKLQGVLADSELTGIFDGPGSYTLLAPSDDAFAALGEQGEALLDKEQRPLLVGLLRDHMLPGHVTPELIAEAIKSKGGPVTMTTLGDGTVTFAQDGDRISVSLDDGTSANFTGTPIATSNGVVIPLDAVLVPEAEG
ncbi:fasciclin domain-containing protein [Erythrobacter mangrovi]|uniref:Fasciclin domain-containing protein n=1 Tax=Erythrobacter mangrovi TaxID=2739433 RepID=A0A7D3XH50_9SPHN|nr:fasciclin domain-containing protein [Erythrobacter mangrovi]QKG70159.1 fasciclin domain-containing protein [Erythrobacter mangrovi]